MKVLIVRVGAFGDVLHALPAVAALRRACPSAQIDWVVDERWAPLLGDLHGAAPGATAHAGIAPVRTASIVDHILPLDTRAWSAAPLSAATFASIRGLRRTLRASAYDLVVDLQGTLRSAVIGRLAGAPRFAGFADPRERLARAFYKRTFARTGTHVVEQNHALLSAAANRPLRLDPSPADLPRDLAADAWATALAGGRRIAVLAPTAGWGAKQWPAPRFGELAQALHRRGFTVFINAAAAAPAFAAAPGRYTAENYAADTGDAVAMSVASSSNGAAQIVPCTVPQLIALLRQAALYVGGDTGPTHLAAALGTPLIALYGPTDPARNGPFGPGPQQVLRDAASPVSHKRVDAPDPGLARIAVAAVLEALQRLPPQAV